MKKNHKLIAAAAVIICVVMTAFCTVSADGLYEGKTVILHTNDVHGAIAGYPYVAAVKAEYVAEGASVILVDAGDFSQDTPYVSETKGRTAYEIMNAVGYNVAIPGNHEYDYGYDVTAGNVEIAEFDFIACNIVDKDGVTVYHDNSIIEKDGLSIAFIGVDTPETKTKTNPNMIKGIDLLDGEELNNRVQACIYDVKTEADIVIGLCHLGVDVASAPYRSYDIYNAVEGLDFIIDGHSHTVMTEGENGEPIQSTGTGLANIGVIVIDNETKTIEDNYLIALKDENGEFIPRDTDPELDAFVQAYIDAVNEEYGAVFAESKVELNGAKFGPGNRDSETNNGDLVADAMLWYVMDYSESELAVDTAHTVALVNGGSIRAALNVGDITKYDINAILPFGNTVCVAYVSGQTLLNILEASTFCTPAPVGGFTQVSGINYTVDAAKAYDANEETYPDSTYYGPKSIRRVTINDINGEAFDPEAIYAVITNDYCIAGGDTFYEFRYAESEFDTGVTLDEAVMEYIKTALGGVIGEEYSEPQGRITIITEEAKPQVQYKANIFRMIGAINSGKRKNAPVMDTDISVQRYR